MFTHFTLPLARMDQAMVEARRLGALLVSVARTCKTPEERDYATQLYVQLDTQLAVIEKISPAAADRIDREVAEAMGIRIVQGVAHAKRHT